MTTKIKYEKNIVISLKNHRNKRSKTKSFSVIEHLLRDLGHVNRNIRFIHFVHIMFDENKHVFQIRMVFHIKNVM